VDRKVLGIVLALSVAFILLTTDIASASATTYTYDFNAAAWNPAIMVPGHPSIGIKCFHYLGFGDVIVVSVENVPLASYTDNPSYFAVVKQVMPSQAVINLVKPWQIQVCRIGKVVIACWTVPLGTSAVTIPPGCLVLEGYGDAFQFVLGPLPTGTGWFQKWEAQNYQAHETFICPGWHYCGPVTGAAISVDGTQTFSGP
jgi:hypothetical protein